jgi:hypothetical protein
MYQQQEDTGLFSKRENNYHELLDQLFEKRTACLYGSINYSSIEYSSLI